MKKQHLLCACLCLLPAPAPAQRPASASSCEALANLRTQLQAIQDKISQDQRDKGVLQSMLLSGEQAPTVDVGNEALGTGGSSSIYDAQIAKLESKLAELKSRYGPSHPDIRRTQNEISRLKAKAATEVQTVRRKVRGEFRDQRPAGDFHGG